MNWIAFVVEPEVLSGQINMVKLSGRKIYYFTSFQEEMESEMKMLRLKLKQTMDLYNSACKEAVSAQSKVK